MDRRLFAFFASVAVLVGAAGYLLAQNRATSTDVEATAVTLLAPQSETPDTTIPAAASDTTVRPTLPPTPSAEVFAFAADAGCTPGGNQLPDGTYHGSVVISNDQSIEFNLKCLFIGEDLPADFNELFNARFPDQEFPATGFDLFDPAPTDRRVLMAWNSQVTFDGGLYLGEEAYAGFTDRDEEPFDATITIEEGIARTVVEIVPL